MVLLSSKCRTFHFCHIISQKISATWYFSFCYDHYHVWYYKNFFPQKSINLPLAVQRSIFPQESPDEPTLWHTWLDCCCLLLRPVNRNSLQLSLCLKAIFDFVLWNQWQRCMLIVSDCALPECRAEGWTEGSFLV